MNSNGLATAGADAAGGADGNVKFAKVSGAVFPFSGFDIAGAGAAAGADGNVKFAKGEAVAAGAVAAAALVASAVAADFRGAEPKEKSGTTAEVLLVGRSLVAFCADNPFNALDSTPLPYFSSID